MPYSTPEKRQAYLERTKVHRAAYDSARHLLHKEEKRLRNAAYHAENRERLRAYRGKYYQENKETINATARGNRAIFNVWKRQYLQDNPDKKVLGNLRTRVYLALRGRGSKSAHTVELLGCTVPELRAHLEAQFRPGMTWENYGPVWHVDHIRPCASFDLLDHAQQRACFHYTNLQPLFAEENLRKGQR